MACGTAWSARHALRKNAKLHAVGHYTRQTKAEPGVLGSRVFTEASAERVGSHICRPVKKSWHATFHSKTNGRSAPRAVHKAIDSVLVLTIADPQK
jgi:hypothetical protein